MASFAEILKKTERSLKIVDRLKKDTINDIFEDYKIHEKIKKLLEKKEIIIGDLAISKLSKMMIDDKDIDEDDYSITLEIEILESLLRRKPIRKEKQEKMNRMVISFDLLKEKIDDIGRDKKSLYLFLDDYFIMLMKKKMINMNDFKRRQLVLKLCDRKSIKSEKYELSKTDFNIIKK